MHEQPQIEIPRSPAARGPFSFAVVVAAAAAVIILTGFYLWPGRRSPSNGAPQGARLPFGATESAYATKIQIQNLALSRAENFLNQEVTILTGELMNSGERALSGVALTVEFVDDMNQIALRESRTALAPPNPALMPGEHRTFEVSFEHIPASWNMQMPAVRVSGLLFAAPSK
jgi:hypothetical protein